MFVAIVKFSLRVRKCLFAIAHPIARRALLRYGVLCTSEHKSVLLVTPFRTVVDIGANRGQFALSARIFCPNADIFCFEPLTVAFDRLTAVFSADSKTFLFKSAVGELEQSAVMNVANRDDSSSLLPITDSQTSLFPGTASIGVETVHIAPLWNFLSPQNLIGPCLLKIDVQGFELKVLKGSAKVLNSFDFVYCECSFLELYAGQALVDEVIRFLLRYDFVLCGVYNLLLDPVSGRSIQADFLFRRL